MASPPGTASSDIVASSLTPNAMPASESHPAPSVVSSRMTDIASEDENEYYPEGAAAASQRPNTRASGGAVTHDSIRPGSAMSSQRGPSRHRGMGSIGSGGWRTANTFGGPGMSMSNSSRPDSAVSRASRTHVPSISSHAFFRPMSSQRLQAQRGGRPSTAAQSTTSDENYSDAGNATNRQSMGSNPTIRQMSLRNHDTEPPPPSRGTEFTDQEGVDRASFNASPSGYETVQSAGDSTRPLQAKSPSSRPAHLDLGKNYKQDGAGHSIKTKSPKSFRASFLLPTKGGSPPRKETRRHERLSSDVASQRSPQVKEPPKPNIAAGSNYEYFTGNTVFCWGGRLQNTRHRPINVGTGIFVLLPSVLFFVYSLVNSIFWLMHPELIKYS